MNVFRLLASGDKSFVRFLGNGSTKAAKSLMTKKLMAIAFEVHSRDVGSICVGGDDVSSVSQLIDGLPYISGRNVIDRVEAKSVRAQYLDVGYIDSEKKLYSVISEVRHSPVDSLLVLEGSLAVNFVRRWEHALVGRFYIDSDEDVVFLSVKQLAEALGSWI